MTIKLSQTDRDKVLEHLVDGNSKENMAKMILSRLTDAEIHGILVYIRETEQALDTVQ